jgi:hypothetical protein
MARKILFLALVVLLKVGVSEAVAIPFVVQAAANSSSGGFPLATIFLTAGQEFTVTASPDDLWSLGALPRWSNADGLIGPRFATGSDESGQPAGTQIGANFGFHSQNGFSAPFGSLVGQIGSTYMVLGTNFHGNAWGTGVLFLQNWDSNSFDNSQFITAEVNAVPEPSTLLLLGGGLALLGRARRARARRAHIA